MAHYEPIQLKPEPAPDASWVRMENLGPALPTRREVALGVLCIVLAAALAAVAIILALR